MLFSCGERIGSVSVFARMKLKHYIMKHDGTNYLYITPLQNQGLVLALLLRAQVCLYGFCDAYFERSADRAHGEQNTGGPENLQEPR